MLVGYVARMGQIGILYLAYMNSRDHTGETGLGERIIAKSIQNRRI
jgi:hypothetical protein